jgi:hypothetical protein
MFARIRTWLVNALALYLARPVVNTRLSGPEVASELAAILRAGDVLLAEGNTRMAAIVRRVTGSAWAHVAMYVGPLAAGDDPACIVEADVVEGVRAVPLSDLTGQRVRVLRPARLHDADIQTVRNWIISRIGDPYDLDRAWGLATRFLRLPVLARFAAAAADGTAHGAARFICSSLLAQAFLLVGSPIVPAQASVLGLSKVDYRHVTPQDFETASVFDVVG